MSTIKTNINKIHIDDIKEYIKNNEFNDMDIDFNTFLQTYDYKVNNPNILNIVKCCVDTNIVEDHSHGILVCTNCGKIASDKLIENNPEWKYYDDEDRENGRCNKITNPLFEQSSIGTNIVPRKYYKIHFWNNIPYKERSLMIEYNKIKIACEKGNIPKCIEDDAIYIYKKVSECTHKTGRNKGRYIITRGLNRQGISAACLYHACLRKPIFKTTKEIALLYGIKDAQVNKGCKKLREFSKMKGFGFDLNIKITDSENVVRKYCEELHIKENYILQAINIVKNIDKLNIISEHTPFSIVAASILLLADIHDIKLLSKKRIATQFNISEVTLSKVHKELEPYKKIISNNDIIEKLLVKLKSNDNVKITKEVEERMKQFGITY